MPETVLAKNGKTLSGIENSSFLSLAFYDQDRKEIKISNAQESFEFKIPRNLNKSNIAFELINTTALNISGYPYNQLVTYKIDFKDQIAAIEFFIAPENQSSYLLAVRYGNLPILNEKYIQLDFYKILCPRDIISFENRKVYDFFLNQTSSAENLANRAEKIVGLGLRELSSEEHNDYCGNATWRRGIRRGISKNLTDIPILNETRIDISIQTPVRVLILQSGCYYLDTTSGLWKMDGLEVVHDLNISHTYCISSHLTDFSGGLVILPAKIDFGYVFQNSSFEQNKTIYITLIVIAVLYTLLFVWCRYMDRKDKFKSNIYMLEEDVNKNPYFYEIIVFTGNRKKAGTNSNVIEFFF